MQQATRVFRVEHREAGATAVLAHIADAFAHHTELTPYVTRILRDEPTTAGHLVLIDEATGGVVARRSLQRPPRAPERWWRPPAGVLAR